MNFVGDLVGAIKAQKEAIMLAMANGNCSSFESYQRLVGEYISLEKVLLTEAFACFCMTRVCAAALRA